MILVRIGYVSTIHVWLLSDIQPFMPELLYYLKGMLREADSWEIVIFTDLLIYWFIDPLIILSSI